MHRQNQRQQVSELELALLRAALEDGQSGFLVKENGRFRWAIICLPSLARGQLRFCFTMLATTEVTFSAVILPGRPGAQRTLFVKHPVSQKIVCARYIRFIEETYIGDTPISHFLFEVRVTGEQLRIPITGILPEIPSELQKRVFDAEQKLMLMQRAYAANAEENFEAEKLEAEAEEQRVLELRNQLAKAQPRYPLAKERTKYNPVVFPYFKEIDLLVLFSLLRNLRVDFKPSYEFNLLIIRFLACGSQENFLEQTPGLSDEEKLWFNQFKRNYNLFFMGNPMTSRMQRFSSLTVQEVFLAESQRARRMQVRSKCALNLPSEYFTGPELGVELRKGPHDCIPHGSLEKPE
jgi:hypothetical protein